MSFCTPNVAAGYLSTPQKTNALNALEMLGHSTFSNVRQVAQAKTAEEPSPARLEGANALAMLFDSSSPTGNGTLSATNLLSSLMSEKVDAPPTGKGRKRKLLHESLTTPSVPKVRRFSPAAGKATSNKKASTLYTPLNKQARTKGQARKNKRQKKKTEDGKRKSTSNASKTPKTENVTNRKEKALGLLCLRFVQEFESRGGEEGDVLLDEAGVTLGVERRRIYDIVNILEAMDIVSRKAKNLYTWHGIRTLPKTIETFENRFRRDWSKLNVNERMKVTIGSKPISKYETLRASGCSREKSLAVLTQQFILLFLQDIMVCKEMQAGLKGEDWNGSTSNMDNQRNLHHTSLVISLDNAAIRLKRGPEDNSQMKTKVRRLYDIANVLCTLDIIYKVQLENKRKPVFAWKGAVSDVYTNPVIGADGLGAPTAISEKNLLQLKGSTCDNAYETPCDTCGNVKENAAGIDASPKATGIGLLADTKKKKNSNKKKTMIKLKKRSKSGKALEAKIQIDTQKENQNSFRKTRTVKSNARTPTTVRSSSSKLSSP